MQSERPLDMYRQPDYDNENEDRRPVANVNVARNPYASRSNYPPPRNFHPHGHEDYTVHQRKPFNGYPNSNFSTANSIEVHIGDKSAQRYFMGMIFFTAIMTILLCLAQPPGRGVVYVGDPIFTRFDAGLVFAFRTGFQNEKDADHTNEETLLEFKAKDDDKKLPHWRSLFFSNMASVAVKGVKYDRKDMKDLGVATDMYLEFGRNNKRSFHVVHKRSATSSTTSITSVLDISNINLFPMDQNACLTFDAWGWRYIYKVKAMSDCKNIINALQRWTTADFFHEIPFPDDQTPPEGASPSDCDYGLIYNSEHNSLLFLLKIFAHWKDNDIDETQIAGWIISITYKKTGHLDDNLETLLIEGQATNGPFSFSQEEHTYPLMKSIDLFNNSPRYWSIVAVIFEENGDQFNPFRLIDDEGIHIETIMTMPNAMFYYKPNQSMFGFVRGRDTLDLQANNFKTIYSEVGEVCMKIIVATKGKPSEFFMTEGCEALKYILEEMNVNVISLKSAQSAFHSFAKNNMYEDKTDTNNGN